MQNLEKVRHKQNSNYIHLNNILSDLISFEKSLSEEKQKLAEWEEEQEFSILGIIDLFTTEIRGYAFQLIENNLTMSSLQIIEHLKKLNLFNISYFKEWYFSENLDFTNIKKYVEKVNYLRLLILEYVGENGNA